MKKIVSSDRPDKSSWMRKDFVKVKSKRLTKSMIDENKSEIRACWPTIWIVNLDIDFFVVLAEYGGGSGSVALCSY